MNVETSKIILIMLLFIIFIYVSLNFENKVD